MMVAGLIAFAVANEMVIAHPHGHTSAALSLLLYGGLILFLVALGWHSWLVLRVWPRPHLVGSAALVPVGIVALAVPPYVALVLVGASLTTLALLDRRWIPDRTAKSISSGSRRSPPDSLSRIFENARRQTAPA